MKTTRLYYQDSYLKEFDAHIVERAEDGRRIYLDRTAFYPASGGQPSDSGEMGGAPVIDVIDEDRRIAHVTSEPVEGVEVSCRIDWPRRFDHMQQHSGQHLLSAVLAKLYSIQTVSFHLGADSSTIEVAAPSLEPEQIAEVETQVNERVTENLPVSVAFEAASDALDLRRPSEREGMLRIVSIQGLDRSACGGTHVRATGEIGPVLIRKLEKIRGNVRIEFLCGMRAVRRARCDADALGKVARIFSASPDETPALAAAQRDALLAAEIARRHLATELAHFRGRELYETTAPGGDGFRRTIQRLPAGSLDEELRALAQGFTAQAKAFFLTAIEDPPAVLLAVSADAGMHAGNVLKAALAKHGGRGGGNALMGQGSVASKALLDDLLKEVA